MYILTLFVKFVKVYENRIEIGLNDSLNPKNAEYVPIKDYVFSETFETTRIFKAGTRRNRTLTYYIYSVI